ncbi:FIG017861: hypothetical protein [hydrothermal vent metagenome]|uniref:Intracellular septation protein A n=1 Tax=hydrothermal vent metagenome TaxID=652676 RepID=A0A3B0YNI6_9ZZZZ
MSTWVVGRWLLSLLFLAYPFIIYLLLTHKLSWLGSILVLGVIIWRIRNRPDWLWWLAAIAGGALMTTHLFGTDSVSKLSPVPIHAGLLFLFLNSLRGTPLIEQFARLDFPELPPEIKSYTRKLTAVWAGFFAFNIVVCLWLALWGADTAWTLYNGLIVYLLIGGLVAGEYVWRRLRFPYLKIPSLLQTSQNIIRNGHKIWGAQRNEKGE